MGDTMPKDRIKKKADEMRADGKTPVEVVNVDAVNMNACDFLQEVDGGGCVFELTQAIQKIVAGVRETSKKGSFSLKVTLDPFRGSPDRIVVGYDVVAKVPEPPKPVSLFFSTMRNTLQRQNPSQTEFSSDEGF